MLKRKNKYIFLNFEFIENSINDEIQFDLIHLTK